MVRRNLEVAGFIVDLVVVAVFIALLLAVLGLSLYLCEAPRASADEYDAPDAGEVDDADDDGDDGDVDDDGDGEPYDVDDPDYDYWLAQQAGSDLDAFGQNQTESVQGPTDSTEPVIVRVEGAGGSSVPQRDIAETIRAVKEADPDAQVLCVVIV